MILRPHAQVRAARPPIAPGYIVYCPHATERGALMFIDWFFPTLEAAIDFCRLCYLPIDYQGRLP